MTNNQQGGHKTKEKLLAIRPDYYSVIGSIGGSKRTKNTKNKGFASMTPEQRSAAGRKGGAVSRVKRDS
jgi:general stress protein YciG